MQNKYPMGDLETQITMAQAHIELLTTKLVELLNETDNDTMHSVAAGLVNISYELMRSLQAAYNEAEEERRSLKAGNAHQAS